MPRPPRIQYENAFYHVMNRGRGRQLIFHDEAYYQAFLHTLEEAHSRFDAQIHAYCLMKNHYHLLVETPRANLDRIMRHINGVYTQRYNRLKCTDGPLFRGRYKALLVDEDAYLLQVGRYIHRNPIEVKGASADVLNRFRWSSYLAYINRVQPPAWLMRDLTYQMLDRYQRYEAYRAFVEKGNDDAVMQFYSKGNLSSIVGDKAFRQAIASDKEVMTVSGDLIKTLLNRPDADTIVSAVAQVFGVSSVDIVTRRRGRQKLNIPRQVAMYCCQQMGDMSLAEVAKYFGLGAGSSVSPAIASVKSELVDGTLKKEFSRLRSILIQ
ncbi:MAG: transposase [Cellvibrionaceae bacterium]